MSQSVYFYVELNSPVDINFELLQEGNPGIGGTQYATLCLALELSRKNTLDVGLIAPFNLQVPEGIVFSHQDSLVDAVRFVESIKAVLVFRPTISLDPRFESLIRSTDTELIAWTHVTPSQDTLRKLARSKAVKKVVALGKRQLMGWIDNPIADKTIVIKNGQYIPNNGFKGNNAFRYVTYLGSMVPQKGFHLLAKVWPEIHQQNPSLRLKVIGSGALYDANAKLGKHGIAASEYEEEFMESLGESSSFVDFLGKISAEDKTLTIANSYLGIVNPSGNTENCPAAALDFQALAIPVISARKYGLIDTVLHGKTGILFDNYKEMPEIISFLMENTETRNALSKNCLDFIKSDFDFEKISAEWENLLLNLGVEASKNRISFSEAQSKTEKIAYLNSKFGSRYIGQFYWPTVLETLTLLKKIIKKCLIMLR